MKAALFEKPGSFAVVKKDLRRLQENEVLVRWKPAAFAEPICILSKGHPDRLRLLFWGTNIPGWSKTREK